LKGRIRMASFLKDVALCKRGDFDLIEMV